jgi:4-hydroxy-tetrahydrodipicolinate reductase
MELVGVYVYSPDKAGRDAGELCGFDSVGVEATNDVDAIVGLEADCVLYMPQATDYDDVCRLLESGTNIVTTRGDFHRPASMDSSARQRVEKACEVGQTSIHSTGSSPGFITEALPIVLTSIQRRLDTLTIDEFADLSKRNSPELLFDLMGYGKDPASFDQARWEFGKHSFGPSLELLAEALSMPLDSVEASGEVAVARRPVDIAAGRIEPGTVAAQRMIVSGIRGGRVVLQMRPTWYCTTEIDPSWDLRPTGWHVAVEGDAPLDIDLLFPVTLEEMGAVTPGYTANRAVNAVPYVCAAAPGIRTTFDLPQIVAKLT